MVIGIRVWLGLEFGVRGGKVSGVRWRLGFTVKLRLRSGTGKLCPRLQFPVGGKCPTMTGGKCPGRRENVPQSSAYGGWSWAVPVAELRYLQQRRRH